MPRTPSPAGRHLRALVAGALTVVLGASAMLGAVAVPASADTLDDLREQQERNEAERRQNRAALEDLSEDLEDTEVALLQTQQELQAIEAQIPVAEQALADAEAELVRLQREAQIIADRLDVAQAEEATITGQIETDVERADDIRVAIGQMAREAYKGDMAASSLSAVLDAQSTDEFVEQSALASTALRTQTQALRDLEQINGVNRNRQARLTAVREQITILKAEADAKVVEAERARAEAEAAKIALEDLFAAQQEKLAAIEAQKQAHLAKQAEIRQAQTALENELKSIISAQNAEKQRLIEEKRRKEAEARRKAEEARRKAEEDRRNQESSGGGSSSGGSSSGGGSSSTSVLGWPSPMTPPYITSHYGWRIHPVYGYRKLHAGTDFRAYCGTPIIAAESGEVQWARYRGGFGNQVLINHGYNGGASLMSSYNHLSRFAVSTGQWVSRGDVVGYSGTTGTSTACHLHFEVYVNGSAVNPMIYLP